MALSTRVSLLFLSLLCAILTCSAQQESEDNYLLTHRYAYEISMEKGHITGIMITKEDDESIVGTLVNEFGVSALSFIYDRKKQKMKLQDVMGMLDKWYIKKVLKADLTYCLHVLYGTPYTKKHNYILSQITTGVSIINPKRKLTYSFNPLDVNPVNETSE